LGGAIAIERSRHAPTFKFKAPTHITHSLLIMLTVLSNMADTAESPPLVSEQESRKRVQELGERLRDLWPKAKEEFLTSAATAMRVDEYYRAGLPKGQVKLVVLSESPCFTRDDIANMLVDLKVFEEAGIKFEGPQNHVNLVHCLTYGEGWALDESTIKASTEDKKRQYNAGTWPFWKVLATIAGMTDVREDGYDPLATNETIEKAYKSIIGGGSSASKKRRKERIINKHQVLEKLREMGILLIDICPYAIYMGGGSIFRTNKETGNIYHTPKHKLADRDYIPMIKAAFETYSAPFLQDVKPEKVLLLGRKVEVAIGKNVLQNVVSSFGGTLLETMIHPCANEFFGKNAVSSLRTVRSHAIAARGAIRVPAQPIELNVPKKKRRRREKTKVPEKNFSPAKTDREIITAPVVSSEPDVSINVVEPPKKKGKRQSRTSQRTELASMHNTGKWPDFTEWK